MNGNTHKGFILQERDKHLLRELGTMRVVDREQAKRVAGFGSTRRVNYRLLGLTRAGLLRRFFLGTKGPGQKALYTQSPNGAKCVDVQFHGLRRRQDEILVTDSFVVHQLAINEIYCELKYRPIPISGTTFEKWKSFFESVEPNIGLIPDGYVEVRSPQKTLAAFLEVDLGTEALSVWKEKVESYLQYAISGRFTEQFSQPQFRVLVIVSSERRMRSLQAATLTLTDKVFWFSSFDPIKRPGFWAPIWLRPKTGERHALLQ